MKKKISWTAKGIVGFIFTPIGAFFTLIAFLVWKLKPEWNDPVGGVVFQSVFGGLGLIFLFLGLIFLGLDLRRRALLRRAYYSGNCVEAEIIRSVPQTNVSTYKGQPFVVECAYTDPSGIVHIYRSRYLYTDVTKLLTAKTVPVYIDRDNEDIGFVDIDAVLPEIRIHP